MNKQPTLSGDAQRGERQMLPFPSITTDEIDGGPPLVIIQRMLQDTACSVLGVPPIVWPATSVKGRRTMETRPRPSGTILPCAASPPLASALCSSLRDSDHLDEDVILETRQHDVHYVGLLPKLQPHVSCLGVFPALRPAGTFAVHVARHECNELLPRVLVLGQEGLELAFKPLLKRHIRLKVLVLVLLLVQVECCCMLMRAFLQAHARVRDVCVSTKRCAGVPQNTLDPPWRALFEACGQCTLGRGPG